MKTPRAKLAIWALVAYLVIFTYAGFKVSGDIVKDRLESRARITDILSRFDDCTLAPKPGTVPSVCYQEGQRRSQEFVRQITCTVEVTHGVYRSECADVRERMVKGAGDN